MTFLIVGLGLIGGSLAKAISGRTDHLVVGLDTNAAVVAQAVDEGAIARRATERDLQTADVVIVALHPQATIDYLKDNWRKFSPETMIFDTCGVKGAIYEALAVELAGEGPIFIGGHPMAGRERYGYDHALVDLFDGASLILTPGPYKGTACIGRHRPLCKSHRLRPDGYHDAGNPRPYYRLHLSAGACGQFRLHDEPDSRPAGRFFRRQLSRFDARGPAGCQLVARLIFIQCS